MGYENCGRRERYPYALLMDGQSHVVRTRSESTIRALRYGARRRGLVLTARRAGPDLWRIIAVPAGKKRECES